MNYINFLKERRSVREYQDKDLSSDQISNINNAITEVEEAGARDYVKFHLVEDSDRFYELLDGKAGYAGVMIKAPAYIAMEYKEESLEALLQGAVFMEELITKLQGLDLSTAWITLGAASEEAREQLFGIHGDNISYALSVGKAKGKRPFDRPVTSSRLDVDQIVFTDRTFEHPAMEEVKNYGMRELFDALRNAPSHKNLQPWRFVLADGVVTLYLRADDNTNWSLTAGGIIMYYFQRLAEKMGLTGAWEIDIQEDGDFYKVGSFKL